ncbi:MAG: alpha/beta hydrolase [Anaerolineae bacterium]|nr:alpha/beta hydrolase [Anaerolineae bacterium]
MDVKDFNHRYIPAKGANAPTLLLLHGTGGNEDSLIDLGQQLVPEAAILSPRGKVLENGYPRFFRRLAEGVFDEADLKARTHELADWVESAVTAYGIDPASLVAVGYSNGANIAASMLLLRPGVVPRAVLLRAMFPLQPEPFPQLSGTDVLISAGRMDGMIPQVSTEKLAGILREAGAEVKLTWLNVDHGLVYDDLHGAQRWIAETAARHPRTIES